MKIGIIIQARMASERLPGKILLPIEGKPSLWHIWQRLKPLGLPITIATTVNPADDPVEAFCDQYGIDFYRGNEKNVLKRFCDVIIMRGYDYIIRITADCPMIDAGIISNMLLYIDKGYDYISNSKNGTWADGLDTEIVRSECLDEINASKYTKLDEREHVTLHIVRHPEKYKTYDYDSEIPGFGSHRWTVDHEEDFILVTRLYKGLYKKNKNFGYRDVLKYLELFPELKKINWKYNRNEKVIM